MELTLTNKTKDKNNRITFGTKRKGNDIMRVEIEELKFQNNILKSDTYKKYNESISKIKL